eukprot:325071-Chlamydomonas_euryale.AAC.5
MKRDEQCLLEMRVAARDASKSARREPRSCPHLLEEAAGRTSPNRAAASGRTVTGCVHRQGVRRP